MPRVTLVKSARKSNPVAEVGESYYWWKFRYGEKRYSKTYPKRSQLTQSGFYAQMWDIEDDILSEAYGESVSDLEGIRDDAASEVQNLLDECQESLDAIPEQLQETHMLYERVQEVESMLYEIESVDFEDFDEGSVERDKDATDEEYAEAVKEARTEHWEAEAEKLHDISYQGG